MPKIARAPQAISQSKDTIGQRIARLKQSNNDAATLLASDLDEQTIQQQQSLGRTTGVGAASTLGEVVAGNESNPDFK